MCVYVYYVYIPLYGDYLELISAPALSSDFMMPT